MCQVSHQYSMLLRITQTFASRTSSGNIAYDKQEVGNFSKLVKGDIPYVFLEVLIYPASQPRPTLAAIAMLL
jgi:hypothetical protein